MKTKLFAIALALALVFSFTTLSFADYLDYPDYYPGFDEDIWFEEDFDHVLCNTNPGATGAIDITPTDYIGLFATVNGQIVELDSFNYGLAIYQETMLDSVTSHLNNLQGQVSSTSELYPVAYTYKSDGSVVSVQPPASSMFFMPMDGTSFASLMAADSTVNEALNKYCNIVLGGANVAKREFVYSSLESGDLDPEDAYTFILPSAAIVTPAPVNPSNPDTPSYEDGDVMAGAQAVFDYGIQGVQKTANMISETPLLLYSAVLFVAFIAVSLFRRLISVNL